MVNKRTLIMLPSYVRVISSNTTRIILLTIQKVIKTFRNIYIYRIYIYIYIYCTSFPLLILKKVFFFFFFLGGGGGGGGEN